MAIFKCKMCGGALEVAEGMSVCECAYCGTTQTLPKLTDDRRANLYDRANHFRRNSEYDKAIGIYEQILNEDGSDAEAYWSLVLCKYGVEYVESPGSNKRVPTVNRVQYTSIFDDENYQCALQHADPMQQAVYAEEAKVINEIQKGILAISQQEEPYDVFICYKEKDALGNRTYDSVLGQELYYELTELGYKVFFARITLENKLGTAYEPYIFAALNSSKVMVVISTKAEYANAPWVKNEWSRYLALIKGGAKKMLIPAYKDMDAYDLPEEFSHLQAQNMEKLGFMQDLVRGIEKIVGKKAATAAPAATAANPAVEPLLKRANIFLGDGMFADAAEYCNKVLDIDPENGEAYVYLLLAQTECGSLAELRQLGKPLEDMPAYRHALRFAAPDMAERLSACNAEIKAEQEQKRLKQQQWQHQRQQQHWEYEQVQQAAQQAAQQQWQQQQWLEQQAAMQRELERQPLRLRNQKALAIARWIQWLVYVALAGIASTIGDESMPIYLIIMLMFTLPQSWLASKAFKFAADNPEKARRRRSACIGISAGMAGFFAIAAIAGSPDVVPVVIGFCYWAVASLFVKFSPRS